MLVLAPALYCWWLAPGPGLSAARALELVLLVALTALTAEVVSIPHKKYALLIAFRFF